MTRGAWRSWALGRAGRGPTRLGAALAVVLLVGGTLMPAGVAWGAVTYSMAPRSTRSYYEKNANPRVLYAQGQAAGKVAAQGLVILDFGRPAYNGAADGTMSFKGHFLYLASVARAVEDYIGAYYYYAPAATVLDVAIGTNNSCSFRAPCGAGVCGCRDEPLDYFAWGEALAATVEQVGAWAAGLRYDLHYTDLVQVVAADDAEPAFDPGFTNTYDMLAGYATAVAGPQPAMVDDGSAEPYYWTQDELLEVAYGFRPDVPMPEVYFPQQAAEWAALARYARRRYHRQLEIFGVLAEAGKGPYAPTIAYANMVAALARSTHQTAIPWLSTIGT